jgi:hypothetical protein
MINLIQERNKTLTEILGFCWHRYKGIVISGQQYQVCIDCGFLIPQGSAAETYPDFSDGMWFVILHSHVKQNPKYMDFFKSDYNPYVSGETITPDLFANSLYYFLMNEELKAYINERNKYFLSGGDSPSGSGEGMVGFTPASA